MLLQRLVEYARDQDADDADGIIPPFYARKPVRWVLELGPDGSPLGGGLQDQADPAVPGMKYGVTRLAPTITRTVAISPTVGMDNPEYVFGWVGEGAKPDRVARQHQAFRELVDQWAAQEEGQGGPGRALASFYRKGHGGAVEQPPAWGRSDLIAFRIGDEFAHETRSAIRFWGQVAGGRKGTGKKGLCLVCGRPGELLKTMPQQIPQRWLPGATQGASLVSVNASVHGYELSTFLGRTPICVDCGLATMGGLTALLSSERHSTTYSGQDSRLAWWVTGGGKVDLDQLDDPDEETVQRLISSVARGEQPTEDDLSMFCALVVGGNVARVVVREWVEMPLAKVQQHIASWFKDHEIVDWWTGEACHLGLSRLVRVTGRWVPGRGGRPGAYAKPGASGEDRPPGTRRALIGAALLGRPLPHWLLSHVVHRIRIDGQLDTARAALVRLALVRRHTVTNSEAYMPILNGDNPDPAYLCGRIFAMLEDLQRYASYVRGGESINVTFTDRYFARAVTSPAVALVAGRRDARAWLKQLRRKRPGAVAAYEHRLDDLFSELDNRGGPPYGAVLTQQAAFILGYHQQRARIRAERVAAGANGSTDAPNLDEPPSEGDHE